jgi:Protein of unknown function (DUF3501)
MRPLTFDDLLPLDEFANQRREYFQSHCHYIDRYRRVRVGPLATMIFENRQTLWFRVQEILRIARLVEPKAVQEELDVFNLLLPCASQLQAAFLVEIDDSTALSQQLSPWNALDSQHLHFCLGQSRYAAHVATCRPEDRTIGATHWVQFQLDESGGKLLGDFAQPAWIETTLPHYSYRSSQLGEDVRQSLVDDLRSP